jgi:hypothetical protein
VTTTNNQLPVDKQPLGDICIPLFVPDDPEWLWYVIKCLSFPTAKRFWVKDDAVDIEAVRKEWENRIYLPFVNRALAGETCPEAAQGDCVEYSARAGFITWQPINPFYDSSIPTGYLQPPFFLWQNILPNIIPDFIEDFAVDALGFAGYEDNDVLTALWCFPFFSNWFNEFAGGFPRFTVQVQGEGSIELHLLNVPLGGRCLITVDVEFNPLDIINGLVNDGFNMLELNKDVFAAPPELETVHIVEIELTDDVEHIIHVTFLPTVNDSFDFINFGGGLRKVVLCGVIPIEETTMDCIDVLDCIDFGDNDSLRLTRAGVLNTVAGVWSNIAFDNTITSSWNWQTGQLVRDPLDTHKIVWKGTETSKFHVSAGVGMSSPTVTNYWLRLIDGSGNVLAISSENSGMFSQLNIDTDVELSLNEYVYLQVRTSHAASINFTEINPYIAAHNITKKGATGAQGVPGIPGDEGAQGTVPPEIEYLFVEQIFENTSQFLADLEAQYTNSPQDIAPNIPANEPIDTEEDALCRAIAAWLRLYAEAKKARLRGLSLLHQVWDALTDAMSDIYTTIVNVIGWNPLPNLFGCAIDNQTAIDLLSNEVAINELVCCLYGEMKDVILLTTTLEGAINACASLTGESGDIACMVQNDLNLQHTLNFYYLYGRALNNDLQSVCPCANQSYIEYDFTVSDWGFTSTNAVWTNGVGWVGNVVENPAGVFRAQCSIEKVFAGNLPVGWAGGMVFDAIADCGIREQLWAISLAGTGVGGGQIGFVSTGDNQHRVWTRNSASPYQPVQFDKVIFHLNPVCCSCPDGKGIIKRVRIWLDGSSPVGGIPTNTYPVGLGPNGSANHDWWQ